MQLSDAFPQACLLIQARPFQTSKIAARHDADNLVTLDDWQMTIPPVPHHPEGFNGSFARCHHIGLARHHIGKRRYCGISPFGNNAIDRVTARENANEFLRWVGYQNRPNLPIAH